MKFGNSKDNKILIELMNKDNWAPNLTKVAQALDIPISTVFDRVNRLKADNNIKLEIVVKINLGGGKSAKIV